MIVSFARRTALLGQGGECACKYTHAHTQHRLLAYSAVVLIVLACLLL
jgi:hypothetical protein